MRQVGAFALPLVRGYGGDMQESYQTATAGGNSQNDMVFYSDRH